MKLYFKFIAIHIKSLMQYKISFISQIIGRFILMAGEILVVFFLFDKYSSVKGFTVEDVLICAACTIFAFNISECITRGFDSFARTVRNSEFDRIMVRPRNEIFLILSSKFEAIIISRIIPGIIILIYAIKIGNVIWTADKIFTYIMMVISGIIMFSSLFMIYAALCFFTLEGLEFMNVLTYGGKNFGQYPFVIYGEPILKFFTFIIPHALFQYYPLLYVLGKSNNKFYMFTPFLAILFIIPSYMFWRFGVKKYKSNGS